MGVLTQLVSSFMFLVLVGSVTFVILPSDPCKRIDRASTITYGILGLVPLTAEKTIHVDMSKRWHNAENMTTFFYDKINNYFKIESCGGPSFSPWGIRSKKKESLDWMKENDPELFDKLQ